MTKSIRRDLAIRFLRSEEYLRTKVEQGHSRREIAAILGVSRNTVKEWMDKHGIEPVKRPGNRPD